MKTGVKEGLAEVEAFIGKHANDPLASGKIFGTREELTESARQNFQVPNADMRRTGAAHAGLYGNSATEALYPTYYVDAGKQPLSAAGNRYALTFPAGQLPTVKAFGSLTMYGGATQLFIENPLDRYLLNSSMMDQFRLGDDGSLTFYIQHESPGKAEEANWLPAPAGPFYVTLRLYGPEAEVREGRWTPPQRVRVP